MYIYGLDLSMSNTGVAIFDTEEGKFVHVSSINTTKIKKPEHEENWTAIRLKHIHDEMNKIISQYEPTVVAIERGFTRHNIATQVLYRVHGVANMTFEKYDQIYYTPLSVKKFVYDSTASKEELATLVEQRTGVEFMNYDESDACAIAIAYMIENKLINWPQAMTLTKKQKEKALNKKVKK